MMRGLQADQEHMAPGDGTAGPEVAAWLNDDFLLGVIMDLTAAGCSDVYQTIFFIIQFKKSMVTHHELMILTKLYLDVNLR